MFCDPLFNQIIKPDLRRKVKFNSNYFESGDGKEKLGESINARVKVGQ